jgi:methionyl-tRNA formyltransferase
MIQKIRTASDPILRQAAQDVVVFDIELENLIDNMIETMRHANGVGLAAPQVGQPKKLLVCEFEGTKEEKLHSFPLTVLCNPVITDFSKEEKNMVEGCLSFPGMEILVKRPKAIKVEGFDRYGKKIEIEAKGLHARVLQHEIDHLNQTLLIDHMQETALVFIGTGSLGVPTLEALAKDPQYKVSLVITGDNQAISRQKNEKVNYIEEAAKKLKLPILKTSNINSPEIIEKIKSMKPAVGIMADFGQFIKDEILEIPEFGIINIHPSLLPWHRGPSPIQQTILDGDDESGVTLIKTGQKMDAGDIISQVSVKLRGTETSTILKEFLAKISATLILNSMPYYIAGDLKPIVQNERFATYTSMFKKEDGLVTSETPAEEVEAKIRAFDAWPKVYTIIRGKRIQILAAHYDKEGLLVIDRVKPEGKKEMSYDEFHRGYHITLTFKQ